MKKIFSIFTVLAIVLFASSCISEIDSPEIPPTAIENGFYMKLEVIQGTTGGADTRSVTTVPAEPGETDVLSLLLLFFNTQTGVFADYIDMSPDTFEGALEMTAPLRIDLADKDLENNNEYRVLVVANICTVVQPETFLERFSSTPGEDLITTFSEAQATLITYTQLGETGFIASDQMLMSSSFTRRAGQVMVHTQLLRTWVRFDVTMDVEGFELYSVAVWNVPVVTALWNPDHNDFRLHTEYFSSVTNLDPTVTEHKGLLYAFENSVTGSYQGDTFTTCLILGIRDVRPAGGTNRVTYYRVNVNEEGAQLLRRNHVYQVTVTGVRSAGENTPRDAWSGAQTWLDINVRNWQDGAGSAVMFDGEDILAVGGNRIDFTGDGGTEEITIFTFSPNPLNEVSITSDLPAGITANLVGATLTVTAEGGNTAPRDGTITVRFGTMQATIVVVQSDRRNLWLNLDVGTIEIDAFNQIGNQNLIDVLGRNITVSSSGYWTAVIHNGVFQFGTHEVPIGETANDQPFSQITGGNEAEVSVATVEPLSQPENHYAFIIFTLDEDPSINRVVVLRQDGESYIRLGDPLLHASIYFCPAGIPLTTAGVGTHGTGEFTGRQFVDVRIDGSAPFTQTLSGPASSAFAIEQVTGEDDNPYIRITPRGSNNTALDHIATVSAFLMIDPSTNVQIQLRQRAHTITLSPTTLPPVSATQQTDVVITVDASAQWTPSLTATAGGNAEILSRTETTFTVRIHPMPTGQHGVAPTFTATATVDGTAVSASVTIQQGQRVLHDVVITTARADWGAWTGGSAANQNNFGRLRDELASTANFGAGAGAVVASGSRTFRAGTGGTAGRGRLPDAGVRVHLANIAAYNAAERAALASWLQGSPYRVLVITNELNSTHPWLSTFGLSGASQGNTAQRRVRGDAATGINRNLYEFLFVNGPFSASGDGSVASSVLLRTQDGVGGTLSEWPGTFVPIVWFSTAAGDVTNRVHMGIDPVQRIVYVGDPEIFGRGGRTNTNWGNPANVEFVRNVAAWIINTTQQGEDFTRQFH